MAHLGSLPLRKSQQTVNDLRKNWGCSSQHARAMLAVEWFNQLVADAHTRRPMSTTSAPGRRAKTTSQFAAEQ
jgi:hypothetical protein